MSGQPIAFHVSIAEVYHRTLGPLLFEPFAAELAGRIPRDRPLGVLETACGTGIATRHLATVVPAGSRITATDLNEGMLEVARRHVGTAAVPLEVATADMTALPFADEAFDLVVCQFGLMFAPDRARAAAETCRVLRRSGEAVVSTWAPLEVNPVPRIAHETIVSFFPADPPRFYELPFSMGDAGALRRLLEEAGFRSVEVERVSRTGRTPSAADAAAGLVEGNPVVDAIRERDPGLVGPVREQLEQRLTEAFGPTDLAVPLEALVARATR